MQLTSVTACDTTLALQKTWEVLGLKATHTPCKSSFSEIREKVSFNFFKDIYEDSLYQLQDPKRTFRGYTLYSIDGDDLNLPCSRDVLENGYRGSLYSAGYETHYPKMYTVFAYDLLNEMMTHFSYSQKCEEFKCALDLIDQLKPKSITIYDRLYGSYPAMAKHEGHGSHYVIRMKIKGDRIADPLKNFLTLSTHDQDVEWKDSKKKGPDISVRLVKIKNRKTNELMVFATNLARDKFSPTEILALYRKRWHIETSFRDLTSTLKMGEWHSKKINGILQEIYALLWLFNSVRAQMRLEKKEKNFLLHKRYRCSNFKMCARLVMDHLEMLINGNTNILMEILSLWMQRTQETRKHRSRSYPRIVRGKQTKFPVHSRVPRRPPP